MSVGCGFTTLNVRYAIDFAEVNFPSRLLARLIDMYAFLGTWFLIPVQRKALSSNG